MVDNTIEKPKKERTQAQISAFEKAKETRANNIAKRKAEKEEVNKKTLEESMDLIRKSKIKEEVEEVKEEVKEKIKQTNDFPKTMTGVNPIDSINKKNKNLEVEVIPPPPIKKVKETKQNLPKKTPTQPIIEDESSDNSSSSMDLQSWLDNGEDSSSDSSSEEEEAPAPVVKKKSTPKSTPKPKQKPKPKKKIIYESEEESGEDSSEEEIIIKKKSKSKKQEQPKVEMDWRSQARLSGF